MCKADGGEILSNIELVLPWNVVKTCYHLEPEGQSCFLALNGEENTSSQITVKKQPDDSVKITVTVMALKTKDGEEEEEEKEEEEEDEIFPETKPSTSRGSPKKPAVKRETRASGKSPASENIFEKLGEDRAGGQSKMAKLRQQMKASPATEAAQNLISSLQKSRTPAGAKQGAKATNLNKKLTAMWGGKKRRRQSAPSGRTTRSQGHEEEEEEEESEEEEEEEEGQQRKQKGVDQDAIQEVIDYMVEQEQEQNPKALVITPEGDDDVVETGMKPGRKRKGQKGKGRPVYMPDPSEEGDVAQVKTDGDQNQPPEEEYEEEEDEDEPQIQIEQLGGSTIIIVKTPEEQALEKKKGRRARTSPRQPLKKRWSAMHANESQDESFYDGNDSAMFRDPYDLDLADDGIGIQKHIISPTKRRRTTAFPGSPKMKKRVPKDGDIECKYCEASVKDYAYLYRHVRKMHSDEVDMQDYLDDLRPMMKQSCPVCNKVFSSSGNVYTHMKQCHSETMVAGHECPECGAEFKNRNDLTNHIRNVHTTEKFECKVCDKAFPDLRQLTEHVSVAHDTTEAFQCDVCHKFYLSKSKLRRHRLIHGAFRHFCPYCSKGFHLKDNMNKHVRIVHESSDSPQHQCPECGKNFLVKGNLTQHIRGVHLKQFAFNCTRCNTGFHRIKSLQQHLETCTGEAEGDPGADSGEMQEEGQVMPGESVVQEVEITQQALDDGSVVVENQGSEQEDLTEQALRIMQMAVEQN